MADTIRQQAERLVALSEMANGNPQHDRHSYVEYEYAAKCGVDIARAYLETQKRLEEAIALGQEVLNAHKGRGAALTAVCGDTEAVIMAREFIAHIDGREGDDE
jgi:hypothetical protein